MYTLESNGNQWRWVKLEPQHLNSKKAVRVQTGRWHNQKRKARADMRKVMCANGP